MTVTRLRTGGTARTNSARAGTEYGGVTRMVVQGTSQYGWLRFRFGSALQPGVTILSATLQLTEVSPWADPVTIQQADSWFRIRRLNWNNQPGVTASPIVGTLAGSLLTFDVGADVQSMIDTGVNNGWRVSTSSTTAQRIYGFGADSGAPVLVVDYAYPPAVPTDLRPAGDAAVAVTKPVLSWTASGASAFQVQIDPTGAFTAPTFDSGTVTSTASSYDLSTSAYGGLTAGSTQWRVRVRNADDLWSDWSPGAEFAYSPKPSASLSQPGATVWETTPPLKLDMTGLVRARFFVADTANPSKVLYDSGEIATTTGEHTPTKPTFTTDGHSYVVTAWGWDDVVRASTTGTPPYSVATTTTTLALDAGTTGVSSVVVAQVDLTPAVDVTVTRAAMPDSFAFIRDGQRIDTDLDPNDLLVAGTTDTYSYRDHTCPPQAPHDFRLAPVVNGKTAADGPGQTVTFSPRIAGVWLLDPDNDIAFQMFGDDEGTFTRPEIYTLHTLEDGTTLKRHFGYGDTQGSITGILTDGLGQTAAAQEALFEQLREDASGVYRLVKVGLNVPVVLVDPQVTTQRRGSGGGRMLRTVSFGFQQQRDA